MLPIFDNTPINNTPFYNTKQQYNNINPQFMEMNHHSQMNQPNMPPFSKNLNNSNSKRNMNMGIQNQYEQPQPMMYYRNEGNSNYPSMIETPLRDPNEYADYDNSFNNDLIINKVGLNSRMENYQNRVMMRNQQQSQTPNQNYKPNSSNNANYYY